MIQKMIKEMFEYLQLLQKNYGWHIHVYDAEALFRGYGRYFSGFETHNNTYCHVVKSNMGAWQSCLKCKEKAIYKSTADPFYGVCHAGVGEFVVPIYYNNESTGMISAGVFREDDNRFLKRLKILQKKHDLPANDLWDCYKSELSDNIPDAKLVFTLLTPAARMAETIYAALLQDVKTSGDTAKTALNRRIKYFINNYYTSKITVSQISEFCRCSESYINHTFQKLNGMNICRYINILRVERSKYLLLATTRSINEIAFEVGFNSYSYYSNLFSEFNGMSPKEYRGARNI